MSIKVTNKQIKVHTDYFNFNPRWELEKAEYAKATIKSVDEKPESRFNRRDKQEVIKRAGDIGESLDHWPRIPPVEDIIYFQFLDKITDKANKFNPQRDEDRRPIAKTGAFRYVTDIIRMRRGDGSEFLLSKGSIVGYDAAGEEQRHYSPFLERWMKTIFSWTNDYNQNTKGFQKICLGPKDAETIYTLPFTKDNARELFNQRANDVNINFIVKDEVSDEARMVEPDVNCQKTLERFLNNTFEFLWAGEYIPLPVRQELRQEAVARGLIKGGAGDFQAPTQAKGAPGVR
ncbi:MAG: hypothetical protein WBN72_02970 [Nitrososphaeraceae archaeon]